MSDVATLTTENANLKGQVAQLNNNANGLGAQLEAHKHTINEAMQTVLNFRANLIMFQKQIQELTMKKQELEKTVEGLNKQLTDATAKIAELTPAAA